MLNKVSLKVIVVSTAQAKLNSKEIYLVKIAAIKKNLTIINAVDIESGKSSLPPTVKSLNLLLPGIPISEVILI